jgi:hypothetical protein
MANETLPGGRTQEDHNVGQDEFEKLIAHSYKPGEEEAAEESAKDGAIDDYLANKEAEGGGGGEKQSASGGGSDERARIAENDGQLGSGYIPDKKPSLKDKNTRKNVGWLIRNRKAVFGGGIVSSFIAIIFFFIGSGPLQFMHFAQLLEQFHFSAQQHQDDDRFMKAARFIHYASSGEVEKTRLGFVGNKLADQFEKKLNASGFKSAYSERFGLFDGYVIDTTSKESPFHGMSDEEVAKAVKDQTGLEAVKGETVRGSLRGQMVIDAKGLSYFKARSLNTAVLTQAKYSKISTSVGSRLMCKRAGCTLHPLKLLSNKKKSSLEDWWDKRNKIDREGQAAVEATANSEENAASSDEEKNAKATADKAANDTSSEAQSTNGDPEKVNGFKTSLSTRILGGGAAAIGVFCMIKAVNNDASEIKQAQVVLPLIRMGTEMMAVGSQLESGQDVSTSELSYYSKLLNGKDSTGKYSSWTQAKSIEAEEGRQSSGKVGEPDDTLKTIGKGVPFDFVNHGIIGSILGPACSTVGSILTGGLSLAPDFTGVGALVGQLGAQVVQSIVAGSILSQMAQWLAGAAVNVTAAGADFGNNVNFGATLAANLQAILSGGAELTKAESNKIFAFENAQAQQDFQKHNIAYRLFSTHDNKSALAQIIDKTSPDPKQNIAMMGSALMNFGNMFRSLPNFFFKTTHAATATPYDYGFPIYGFSQGEMDDPLVENPYENACYVVGCHDGVASAKSASGSKIITAAADTTTRVNIAGIFEDQAQKEKYTKMADDCFSISLSQDSSGRWDATSSSDTPPNPYNDYPSNCKDKTDKNWLRVRMFIKDTMVMNSMGCYAGDDNDTDTTQACNDIGFENAQIESPDAGNGGGDNGSLPSGSAEDLAKQILDNPKINKVGREVTADLQAASKGQPATAGTKLTQTLLALIVEMGQNHSFNITALESGGTGHSGPGDPHYEGRAIDIDGVDGDPALATEGRTANDQALIKELAPLMPKSPNSSDFAVWSGFGQSNCGSTPSLPAGIKTFSDTCNHLHIQVAPN